MSLICFYFTCFESDSGFQYLGFCYSEGKGGKEKVEEKCVVGKDQLKCVGVDKIVSGQVRLNRI